VLRVAASPAGGADASKGGPASREAVRGARRGRSGRAPAPPRRAAGRGARLNHRLAPFADFKPEAVR
jgi:hypothetical protein